MNEKHIQESHTDNGQLDRTINSRLDSIADKLHKLPNYKRQVQEISGEKATNVFISRSMEKIPLPKDSVVEFCLDDKRKIAIYPSSDRIEVYGVNGGIIIKPQAANHCVISTDKAED